MIGKVVLNSNLLFTVLLLTVPRNSLKFIYTVLCHPVNIKTENKKANTGN